MILDWMSCGVQEENLQKIGRLEIEHFSQEGLAKTAFHKYLF